MKESLTELVFILDRSGSMYSLTSDTIGGFNSLIEKQKAQPGDADVTTVLFDNEYEILHDHLPLREIRPLTEKEYCVQGCTALLDAVGMTINAVGARLNNTPENERPGKVVVVIVTDGEENASHEYTKAQVKKMITHQQEKYSWDFIFLGANIDAEQEASSLGIRRDFARNYEASKEGTERLFNGVSMSLSVERKAAASLIGSERNVMYEEIMQSLDQAGSRSGQRQRPDNLPDKKKRK